MWRGGHVLTSVSIAQVGRVLDEVSVEGECGKDDAGFSTSSL